MSLALADELFLMMHDLQTGKPRVADPALGVGLASALLAELMFAGCVVLTERQLALGAYGPPPEPLAEGLYESTRNQLFGDGVTALEWLSQHARNAHEAVADRLVRDGELRRETGRRLGRTVVRHYPVNPASSFIRAQRLPSYLRHRVEVTEADVMVARLAQILAPGASSLELDAAGLEYLEQLVPALQPPFRELLSIIESAYSVRSRGPYF